MSVYTYIRVKKSPQHQGGKEMKITVKTDKELKSKISEMRHDGWFLITLGKRLAELEKGDQIVVIER
jgi:hypothetical protein